MHILLTGATGYIGKRLLYALIEKGHHITCCVRDKNRFVVPYYVADKVDVIETDFQTAVHFDEKIKSVDAAYYLIHSMTTSTKGYSEDEWRVADNFSNLCESLSCKQVIYLGGIANESQLSEHLESRKGVEERLKAGNFATTILRAAIIVGSGSASFEIIRDLVEKLPIMITPKWVKTECQPIAIANVIDYLIGVLRNDETYNQTYDIGGPDILTYKEMMLVFGKVRGLKRYIYTIPVMTPRLSSYWLYFITSTNYRLAVNLVKSMKIRVVCKDNRIQDAVQVDLIPYEEAVRSAFDKIEQNLVVSSWHDALSSHDSDFDWNRHIKVPSHGTFKDRRQFIIAGNPEKVLDKIWGIGGNHGWYFATWLWKIRGALDRMIGGVGLRRGRTNANVIRPGDALDFWRVLVADRDHQRMLLYAEMKLPGEAWLEFNIESTEGQTYLTQQAIFRPRGLLGRLYWYSVKPLHNYIFEGLGRKLTQS